MAATYWLKQTKTEPLFSDLIWSRPEHKKSAGKLIIIGGNAHAFVTPAVAYNEALAAGVGTVRVLLPDAVKKLIGPLLENGEFAPSTPSGSFAVGALSECLEHSRWADGVLMAGDLGRNSETAILFEKFISEYRGQLTLSKDALDHALGLPEKLLRRSDTLVVASFEQLQKLLTIAGATRAISFKTDLLQIVETLHELTIAYPLLIVIKHLGKYICAGGDQVSTTELTDEDTNMWRVKTASHASVWWLQNPTKPFEALTTSVFVGAGGGT